jgi:hypothetical protein
MRGVLITTGSRWVLAVSAALFLTAAAHAQQPAPDTAPPSGHGPRHGSEFGGGPFGERMELLGIGGMHGKVVTGAPFTAVASASTKQTLSDGTLITRTVQSNLFRDAQGRFRKETTMPAVGPLAASGTPKTFVMIQDPVAKANYMLDPGKKVAHQMPQRGHGNSTDAADSTGAPEFKGRKSGNSANVVKESLGTQTINGVSAQGTRFTRTIPAGQIGNDKPLSIVREEWYSPELQMVIQSKHSDPFMGETTYTVANIQRTAPDASLFSVPSDYTVKSGPGPRSMRRGHGAGGQPPASDSTGPGM